MVVAKVIRKIMSYYICWHIFRMIWAILSQSHIEFGKWINEFQNIIFFADC